MATRETALLMQRDVLMNRIGALPVHRGCARMRPHERVAILHEPFQMNHWLCNCSHAPRGGATAEVSPLLGFQSGEICLLSTIVITKLQVDALARLNFQARF